MTSPFRLDGCRILVTGASGGLGRAIAVLAAHQGARLVLTGRDSGRLQETAALLVGSGHVAEARDLSDRDALSSWLVRVAAEGGALAGLVHAAGIQQVRPLRMLDDAALHETLTVNLATAVALSRAFRQRTVCAGGGSIVYLSSVMGLAGQPGQAAYCASKAALIGLCRSLALELAREKIRVNCVAPGLVETEMAGRLRATLPQAQFDAVTAMHPLGLGRPEDVAASVVFLLSSAAAWITGTTLTVDGGYTAQ